RARRGDLVSEIRDGVDAGRVAGCPVAERGPVAAGVDVPRRVAAAERGNDQIDRGIAGVVDQAVVESARVGADGEVRQRTGEGGVIVDQDVGPWGESAGVGNVDRAAVEREPGGGRGHDDLV